MQAIPNLPARLNACRGVLVDSNVLLDVATSDPDWSDWSGRALAECAEHTTLIINPIIYAEVSIGYKRSQLVHRNETHVETVSWADFDPGELT